MNDRKNQVWFASGYLNGDRVFVVINSRIVTNKFGLKNVVHDVLHVTGKKMGKILDWSECEEAIWDTRSDMIRLDH